MPAVLKQTLFIDMHTVGLEVAIAQIVSVTQGHTSFTPQYQGFSNLTYVQSAIENGSIEVTIQASRLMEPNPGFALIVTNVENEVSGSIKGQSAFVGGFNKDAFNLVNGGTVNTVFLRPVAASLTPTQPLRLVLKKTGDKAINLIGVLHQRGENTWASVPVAQFRPS
ncbi:hypothetical protein [Solilutibacter pythonis]|uniref:hypothetical protein n=1 Tax=Solilutibacter pythonis TaxID=2483112 RepID=UPI001B88387A|nr:hypothetical protein [Lysobacter pythonis]